ncbi:MAG: tetratricopeptide repeat protein [Lentisphaeria bacterium]|nr:tetratricopeptide repeat protein [Lentisphaeria bacterium]
MLDFINKHNGFLLGFSLLVMTLAAYLPAMTRGGFIWDDDAYIIYNKTLRDTQGLMDIWTDPQATPQYYPLVHTSYWLEYRFWGLNPTGYHVNNVLLHALAALLLWRVLKRLKIPGAWLAAALFAAHPVHVESVAWVTERKNVLSGVFYLGAALTYLKWAEAKADGAGNRRGYLAAFVLFVCALLSKTVTASLPAALLLVAWWKDGDRPVPSEALNRREKSRLITWIPCLAPFFVIGVILSGLTVWLEKHHVGAKGAEWHLSVIDRCLVAGRALWFYIGKLLWPAKLTFSYPRWEINATVWWQYLFPLAFAVLLVLLWAFRKRVGRGPLVAILFFAGTLFPALGFLDVYPFRYSFVADHFQYHASIGVLVLVAAGIVKGLNLLRTRGKDRQGLCLVGIIPTAVLLGILVILSAKQCKIYCGLEELWLDTINKNPASWMAYNNLGKLYIQQGKSPEAIPILKEALRHNPTMGKAYKNIGVALSRMGRQEEAISKFQKALEIDPKDAEAYSNIGSALAKEGKFKEAVAPYLKALEIDPGMAVAHSNLGSALGRIGCFDEAIPHHEKALELMPELGVAHLHFGETLHAAGRIREAEEQYRSAIEMTPSLPAAHLNLGMIAVADQLLPAALYHFRRAVETGPELAETHRNLAKVLAAIGQPAEAITYFDNALQLEPRSADIRIEVADFLLALGKKAEARDQYLVALELKPGDPTLLFKLGTLDQKLGDAVSAMARFRTVLKLDPDHASACNVLAVLLAGKGGNEEAVDLLRQAVKVEPGNAEFHNNLGVILVRAGKRAEALEALETAVRLNPDYGEAQKNLDDLRRLLHAGSQP